MEGFEVGLMQGTKDESKSKRVTVLAVEGCPKGQRGL